MYVRVCTGWTCDMYARPMLGFLLHVLDGQILHQNPTDEIEHQTLSSRVAGCSSLRRELDLPQGSHSSSVEAHTEERTVGTPSTTDTSSDRVRGSCTSLGSHRAQTK